MSIRITADSPADLPAEFIEEYSVNTIPLHIILGGESYDDGITVVPQDIYENYSKNGELPKTAAVSIGEYTDFFEKMTKNGDSVIHFGISSGISSSFNNACIASRDFDGVYVVDTKSLTVGIALLIVKAHSFIKDGMSAEEVYTAVLECVPKLKTTFLVSSLEYLHKGGRCSSLSLLGANILSIKPSVKADIDGKLVMDKKYRGKTEKCIENYICDLLAEYDGKIDTQTAVLARTDGVSDEAFSYAADFIKEKGNFERIFTNTAGCTITSHCGKGAFTFMFMTE